MTATLSPLRSNDLLDCAVAERVVVFRTSYSKRKHRMIHYECAADAWKEGTFHNPIFFAKDDLENETCIVCEKPMLSNSNLTLAMQRSASERYIARR